MGNLLLALVSSPHSQCLAKMSNKTVLILALETSNFPLSQWDIKGLKDGEIFIGPSSRAREVNFLRIVQLQIGLSLRPYRPLHS
jgi:hypothetical protein